ncbi:MAG: SH3 domain-containing protein, partial [Mesorhizobium sp.]
PRPARCPRGNHHRGAAGTAEQQLDCLCKARRGGCPEAQPRHVGSLAVHHQKNPCQVPDTGARIITTLPLGDLVQTNGQQGDWYNVTVSARNGWIHGDYLSEAKPVELTSTTPVAPAAASDDGTVSEHASGDPVRDAVVGRCDCPYDLMRNGRLCGGRSAYSKPGGRSPVCYW